MGPGSAVHRFAYATRCTASGTRGRGASTVRFFRLRFANFSTRSSPRKRGPRGAREAFFVAFWIPAGAGMNGRMGLRALTTSSLARE